MATYFSSDYHLGHTNIIKYDGRPFNSVEEMDETIIKNHNSVVKPKDDFYFLGDLCFNNKAYDYLRRLNGRKFFIRGNHDRHEITRLYRDFGTYLGDMAEITVGKQRIVLCHYSMNVWNKSHRGVWHLYGHSHHSLPDNPNSLSFDAGINGVEYNYTPFSFEYAQERMSKKTYKSIDHHGR